MKPTFKNTINVLDYIIDVDSCLKGWPCTHAVKKDNIVFYLSGHNIYKILQQNKIIHPHFQEFSGF